LHAPWKCLKISLNPKKGKRRSNHGLYVCLLPQLRNYSKNG
jgi:hypothetical protein